MSRLNVKPRTIFCRDNLDILKGMNSECVDLIYLDPPFNKNKIFAAPIGSSAEGAEFKDIFREEDVKDEWVREVEQDNPELHELLAGIKNFSNKYNYCYCVYMAIRLMEMQRILKPSGSLYLHCDPTMSHYLKLILDCIFGENNFRNEIIWHYGGRGGKFVARQFPRNHDSILFYGNSGQVKFNRQFYKNKILFHSSGYKIDEKNRCFRTSPRGHYTDDSIKKLEAEGRIYRTETGTIRIKYFEKYDGTYVYENKLAGDTWNDIHDIMHVPPSEKTGYPTQKPLKLLERIVNASSNKGGVVLDPFCGCATTCVAAEKLERTWIGIDVSLKAYELVKMRLAKEVPTDLFRGEPNFSTVPPKRGKEDTREAGYVYIMRNELLPNQVKVGVSKNPESRAKSVMAQAPKPTEVVWKYKTIHYREIEHYIHQEYPRKKEWVTATIDEIKKKVRRWKPA